jgi:SAM-dependent methyltransferase
MLGWDTNGDALVAPAVARNRDVILDVLRRVLPSGLILEIASGSGEHAVHFARALPSMTWQPSDHDAVALRSIAAHAVTAGLPNLLAPVDLDAGAASWPLERADAVVSINMIHIAPWAATAGLMKGAARLLPKGGCLLLYGPFKRGGQHTSPSNAAFDGDLRARNPEWGVRDVAAVSEVALVHGLRLDEVVPMPANNLGLVFRPSRPQQP